MSEARFILAATSDFPASVKDAVGSAMNLLSHVGVALRDTLDMTASELIGAMDDHEFTRPFAQDHADMISDADPSLLCDRYGDWCEFGA